MSTTISVWSRVLVPGQDALISEDVSLQITNIVLEFDESKPASEKRSTLKMQHLTANPALLEAAAAAQYDSDDYDSDEFDSEIDSDDAGDFDDEDDEEEMADISKISKASSSASTSSKKAASKAALAAALSKDLAAEEAAAGGEDESSEDDEEFDAEFERQEAEVLICSFLPGRAEQFTTNLILPGEEDFVFKLSGEYKVHLFGHYIMQPVPGQFDNPPTDYDSQDEDGSDDEYPSGEETDDYMSESELAKYDPETGLLLDFDQSFDEDEEDDSRFMEIEEEKPTSKKAAKEVPAVKKEKTEAPKPVKTEAATPAVAADTSKLSKNQLKKLAKKEKTEAPAAAPAAVKKEEAKSAAVAAPAAAKKAASNKQTLPSGLVIEDNKVGSGSAAKSGHRLQMRYIGRLSNGKIFDQNIKGAPFSFKLGKGEVIAGWDKGLVGMQVGGERKLTIPANMAYGKSGVAGIPPNSTLTFEVKLLGIK